MVYTDGENYIKRGLLLGKFLPLHLGHISLIRKAASLCDELIVWVCVSEEEEQQGWKDSQRILWVRESFKDLPQVEPVLLRYSERLLPNTSVSSREVSRVWADKAKEVLPPLHIVFSSEPYGAFLAEFLGAENVCMDPGRLQVPIHASAIRQDPFRYWDYIAPAARAFFVKKICLYGTESTGKTVFAERLARHYQTSWVAEAARDIVSLTRECRPEHLQQIAEAQAQRILQEITTANKLLFVDTDLRITQSYSRFLFHQSLDVPAWIEEVQHMDLHLLLDKDGPFVQDGTRLQHEQRDKLHAFHLDELQRHGGPYVCIQGEDWELRFKRAVEAVDGWLDH